jgi:2-hydroxychromene-2-carboxylate isomerase
MRHSRRPEGTMAKHVDYYVSLNSPWTYLGSKRFEAMAKKHNAHVSIWPVDFGSVFAVSGGLPLPKRAPQRQAYRMMELKRWRDHLGMKEMNLEPKFFPANEVPAANCVIALRELSRMADAIKLAHAVLAALWEGEKNTGDPETLRDIIIGCGLDANLVMKASEAPGMADKRESYTKFAIDQGVFGAPSFVINKEIFWGQDRLDFVERKLAS